MLEILQRLQKKMESIEKDVSELKAENLQWKQMQNRVKVVGNKVKETSDDHDKLSMLMGTVAGAQNTRTER